MDTWKKSAWFAAMVSTMRDAIANALTEIDEASTRIYVNEVLRGLGMHKTPQDLSAQELVTELGKAMTRNRIGGQSLAIFNDVCSYLPSLTRIRDALAARELYDTFAIPPIPPVLTDGRVPAKKFLDEINEQVFVIHPS
jgi:hypothetical protein